MDPRKCSRFEECFKISMVMDKDLLDWQYSEAIESICDKCQEGDRETEEDFPE